MHNLLSPRARLGTLRVLAILASIAPVANMLGGRHATAQAAAPAATAPAPQESWEVFYLQNAKIGYGQVVVRPVEQSGKRLLAIDCLNRLSITRFGQRTVQDLKMSTLETPDGELLEFSTDMAFGTTPVTVRGRVERDKMTLETTTKGTKQTSQIPWSKDVRGFRAVEQSLERRPLKPGEKRKLKMLMPLLNQVAEVELAASDYETTAVLGLQTRLLRVECLARLPDDNTIASTLWTDTSGQAIKTRMQGMQQESFRTSRELAIAEQPAGAKFDLGLDMIVKPDKPLPEPQATRQVRYQVELADSDPSKLFASGPTQSVRSLGPHTAELTVRSVRPGSLPPAQPAEPVGRQYTAANSVLQLDDPRVKAMALEARAGAKTLTETALALERYVHTTVANKNFTQTFATAAEVAESREGDCTEHAVLLAALARVCGIPSRVAIGLVYVESVGGFGYHMWTEMHLDGRWIPLDATLGRGGIAAAHLKLTDSSLDGAAAYSAFLPVAQVVGQLKIRVLAVE